MTTCSLVFRASAVLGATALVVIFFLELNRRHDLYWYDVREDYRYAVTEEAVTRVPVRITAEGVSIPALEERWDTAFLPIEIAATLTGSWFEPTIEIGQDGRSWLQTFERGARGLRYLVLDPDAVGSGGTLRFSGRHVRWRAQGADLMLFATPEIAGSTLLVLAPHPDDAEIAAFGLYSSRDSYVATVSAGNYVDGLYAHLAVDPADQDSLRGRVRAWDSLVVPTWGGVQPQRIVNLGYWNGSLQGLHDRHQREIGRAEVVAQDPNRYRSGAVAGLVDGRRAEATWDSLVEDLRILVETVGPRVIATPHPALDAAPDHQYTTLALLAALKEADDKDAVLLLYTNHHVLSEYYPFGPAESAVGLPPWFDATGEFFGVYSHWLSAEDQMDKLFALEAMHDLRAPPRLLHGGPARRFVTLVSAAFDGLVRNPLGTYSYVRRAVRANEVFFVVRPEDRQTFEAGLQAGATGAALPPSLRPPGRTLRWQVRTE